MNLVQCRSFIIRRWKTTEESSSYTVSACELKLFHYQESLLHLRSLDTFLCQTTSHHPIASTIRVPCHLRQFFTEVTLLIDEFATFNSEPITTGELNIHLETLLPSATPRFLNILPQFSLPQYVVEQTHTLWGGWTDAYTRGVAEPTHTLGGWFHYYGPRNGPLCGDVSLLSDHSTEDLHPLIDQLSSSVTDPLMRSATVNSGALYLHKLAPKLGTVFLSAWVWSGITRPLIFSVPQTLKTFQLDGPDTDACWESYWLYTNDRLHYIVWGPRHLLYIVPVGNMLFVSPACARTHRWKLFCWSG